MKKVVILISGSGSLIESFVKNTEIEVYEVIANRNCLGLEVSKSFGIKAYVEKNFDKNLAEKLNQAGVEIIVLAGFLKILSADFIANFEGKIVNCHPALLPKFGGYGFYGDKVHKAVIEAGESESGFTIHLVTPQVDEGSILKQIKVPVFKDDTVESLSQRVRNLEKQKYAQLVAEL